MKQVYTSGWSVVLFSGLAISAMGWWAAPADEVVTQPRAAAALQTLIANPQEAGPLPEGPVLSAELGAFVLATYNPALSGVHV